jgi:hypothetical protein
VRVRRRPLAEAGFAASGTSDEHFLDQINEARDAFRKLR